MLDAELINFADFPASGAASWNEVLMNSSEATIFHTPEWIRLITEVANAKIRIVMAKSDGAAVGILPFSAENRYFLFRSHKPLPLETPYGGPVAVDTADKEEILIALVKSQEGDSRTLSYCFILPPGFDKSILEKSDYRCLGRSTMWLNLKGMGTQPWNSLNMNTRRSIIKAQENGVTIEEKGIGDVAEYYKMLISTYGRLGIRQAPPLDLYRKALILLNGRIKLFFAKYKSINIAGGIFLFFKDTVTFWNGASYKQYWDVCPNHLLHWSIICSGRDNGFTFYNMLHYHNRQGKIIPGLERFKSGFGARPRFFYCAYKSSPYAMYNFARALTGKGEQT